MRKSLHRNSARIELVRDDANRMLHVVYQLFAGAGWGLVFKTGDIVHSYKFARVKFSRITSNE